jgi:hypothetical protein
MNIENRFLSPIIPITAVFFIIFLTTGCPETWLKEIGGDTYGSLYGVILDTNSVGINDVKVGLTAAEDAKDFIDDEVKLIAKCRYLIPTGPAISPYTELGDGFYYFDRVDINMNSKYIVVWTDGYLPEQVESRIEKFATTPQLPIYLTKQ